MKMEFYCFDCNKFSTTLCKNHKTIPITNYSDEIQYLIGKEKLEELIQKYDIYYLYFASRFIEKIHIDSKQIQGFCFTCKKETSFHFDHRFVPYHEYDYLSKDFKSIILSETKECKDNLKLIQSENEELCKLILEKIKSFMSKTFIIGTYLREVEELFIDQNFADELKHEKYKISKTSGLMRKIPRPIKLLPFLEDREIIEDSSHILKLFQTFRNGREFKFILNKDLSAEIYNYYNYEIEKFIDKCEELKTIIFSTRAGKTDFHFIKYDPIYRMPNNQVRSFNIRNNKETLIHTILNDLIPKITFGNDLYYESNRGFYMKYVSINPRKYAVRCNFRCYIEDELVEIGDFRFFKFKLPDYKLLKAFTIHNQNAIPIEFMGRFDDGKIYYLTKDNEDGFVNYRWRSLLINYDDPGIDTVVIHPYSRNLNFSIFISPTRIYFPNKPSIEINYKHLGYTENYIICVNDDVKKYYSII